MVRDVSLNLIGELQNELRLDEWKRANTKQRALRWAQSVDLPVKYKRFYGKSAVSELRSVVKELKKGISSQTVSIAMLKGLKLPQIKELVDGFLEDLAISQDYSKFSQKRLSSYIERAKIRELLGKTPSQQQNVQVQVVNEISSSPKQKKKKRKKPKQASKTKTDSSKPDHDKTKRPADPIGTDADRITVLERQNQALMTQLGAFTQQMSLTNASILMQTFMNMKGMGDTSTPPPATRDTGAPAPAMPAVPPPTGARAAPFPAPPTVRPPAPPTRPPAAPVRAQPARWRSRPLPPEQPESEGTASPTRSSQSFGDAWNAGARAQPSPARQFDPFADAMRMVEQNTQLMRDIKDLGKQTSPRAFEKKKS